LGVDCYAWSSSPLRRYVDLINQWQLIAWLRNEPPPYTAKSPEFLAALRDFELTYAAYAELQRGMERYWCLRWLAQADLKVATATVLREHLVRLETLPLVLRTPSLPALDRGARVELEITRIDLLDADINAQYRTTLAEHGEVAEDEDGEGEDAALVGAEAVSEIESPTTAPELVGAQAGELAANAGSASALGDPTGTE
ncbi:MAG: hypothetical protein K2X64_11490, partial [Rhodocyclaceae bacterium]|nr:hypothetical protein [Rhodocyclaceae bacterium]